MNRIRWILILGLTAAVPAFAQTYAATDTPLSINAKTSASSVINVPDQFTISDLNVVVDVDTQGNIGDLRITLFTPSNQPVLLKDFAANPTAVQSLVTVFNDECDSPPADTQNSLAGLVGTSAQGSWSLQIENNNIDPGVATLSSWSLVFNSTPSGTGIAGLITGGVNQTVYVYNPLVNPNTLVTSVFTDASGNYCVEVPPGVYWVNARAVNAGCNPLDYYEISTFVVVNPGQYTLQDFELIPPKSLLAKGCGGNQIIPSTVVGTVINSATNQPIADASVSLDDTTPTATDSGVYFFTVPSSGNHTVKASAPGFDVGTAMAVSGGSASPEIADLYLTPSTGSIQVTITPADVVTAGAQWRVDGGTYQGSGVTLNDLGLGNHLVEFNTVSGWITPDAQTVSVSANTITTAQGVYRVDAGPADVNGDSVVDAVDVQLVINAALGIDVGTAQADVNGDSSIDAVDVQLVINQVLANKSDPSVTWFKLQSLVTRWTALKRFSDSQSK